MAFTVEDGTGVENANAYCEVAFVTEYLTDRARQTENGWSTSATGAQQAAIIAATDYVEQRYGRRFLGYPEFPEVPQGLSFPRLWLYDRNGLLVEGVPLKLKQAIAEYATRAVNGTKLMPDPVVDESGRQIRAKKEVVGPIETSLEYEGSVALQPYPAADRLLLEYIGPGGGVSR